MIEKTLRKKLTIDINFDQYLKKNDEFEHYIDFAYQNLIQTFCTIVHLKIFNNNDFNSNVSFFSLNCNIVDDKFVFVVHFYANATIQIVFDHFEIFFEKNECFIFDDENVDSKKI